MQIILNFQDVWISLLIKLWINDKFKSYGNQAWGAPEKELDIKHYQRCSAHRPVQALVRLREAGAACLCFIVCVLSDR